MKEYTQFSLAKDVPYIHNSLELGAWLRDEYTLSEYMTDYDTYNEFMARLMNLLRASYVIKSCREYPVKFKFNPKDKKVHELQFRHFIVNMILWYPFVELNELNILDESFIIDCDTEISSIEDFINAKIIATLRDHHLSSTTVNYDISIVLYNLRRISIDFSLIMGLNFSILTFLDMYQNNEEIRDMMEIQFDERMQPSEIEQKLSQIQAREIEIYKSDMSNPIGAIFRAGSGIKHKQFTEFTVSEGLKPTLDGKTIPKPIENSTLLRGLDRPSYLYLDATGAREPKDLRAYVEIHRKQLLELLEVA